MPDRDVLREIRNHFDALLDIFMQQIGAQLGIENTGGKKDQGHNEQDGDKCDKQVRDDQAVAQAPEQTASPPADEANEKINGREDSKIFQKIGWAGIKTEKLESQPGNNQEHRKKIEPGKAVPDFFERSANSCHRAVSENNTLPESMHGMQWKHC